MKLYICLVALLIVGANAGLVNLGVGSGYGSGYGNGLVGGYGSGLVSGYGSGLVSGYGSGLVSGYGSGLVSGYGGGLVGGYGNTRVVRVVQDYAPAHYVQSVPVVKVVKVAPSYGYLKK